MRYHDIINKINQNNKECNNLLLTDLSLSTVIQQPSKLTEYKLLTDIHIPNYDFSLAGKIGTVNTALGILDVYRMYFNNNNLFYGLIDTALGLTMPVCYIGFTYVSGLPLLRKNSYCRPEHRNKGLISELNFFIANTEGEAMISDTHMSIAGLKTWEKLFRLYPTQTGIFHGPTLQTFPLSAANTTYKGVDVVDPKDDNNSNYYWFQNAVDGQKWFYIYQASNQPPITESDHITFNLNIRNLGTHRPRITFGNGYE